MGKWGWTWDLRWRSDYCDMPSDTEYSDDMCSEFESPYMSSDSEEPVEPVDPPRRWRLVNRRMVKGEERTELKPRSDQTRTDCRLDQIRLEYQTGPR